MEGIWIDSSPNSFQILTITKADENFKSVLKNISETKLIENYSENVHKLLARFKWYSIKCIQPMIVSFFSNSARTLRNSWTEYEIKWTFMQSFMIRFENWEQKIISNYW